MCSWSCPNNVLFCPRLVPIPTLPLVWTLFWPPGVWWPCVRYCEHNLDDLVLYGCPTKNYVVCLIHFLGRIFFPPPSSKLFPQPSNFAMLFFDRVLKLLLSIFHICIFLLLHLLDELPAWLHQLWVLSLFWQVNLFWRSASLFQAWVLSLLCQVLFMWKPAPLLPFLWILLNIFMHCPILLHSYFKIFLNTYFLDFTTIYSYSFWSLSMAIDLHQKHHSLLSPIWTRQLTYWSLSFSHTLVKTSKEESDNFDCILHNWQPFLLFFSCVGLLLSAGLVLNMKESSFFFT